MNLDDEDLEELAAIGRKISGRKPAPKKEDEPEVKLLQKILKALEHVAVAPKPEPIKFPDLKPPTVNVSPTPVVVNPSKPITKWKFTLTKDSRGHTTEIIATAIE